MTDREAIERLNLMAKGGTNFSAKSNEACRMGAEALQECGERRKEHQWKITLAELPKSEEDVLLYWCDSDTMAVGFALYENDEPVSWCAYTGGEWYTDCNSSPDLWIVVVKVGHITVKAGIISQRFTGIT